MAAKFLCCLPLRFGVILISFLQFLFCGAFAGLVWWALIYGAKHNSDIAAITESIRTPAIVAGSVYTVAAIVGLLGLLGALFRKNAFVKTFNVLLYAILALETGSGVWYLVTYYRTRGQTVDECINGSTNKNQIAVCNAWDSYRRVPQGVMIASVIVPIVIQAYACYVVHHYSKRLEHQRIDRLRSSNTFVPPVGPMYQPVMRSDETHPLTQPVQQYPYSDAAHAFGHQPQRSLGGNEAVNKV